MAVRTALLAMVLALSGTTAFAQPASSRPARSGAVPDQRVFISIDAVTHLSSRDFDERLTIVENAENGSLEAAYDVASGPAFSISGGAVLWRSLGVAVGVTRFSKDIDVPVTAEIPHPFFFARLRPIEGEATVAREELGVHVQARMVVPAGQRWQVMIFGGPSFFSIKQGLVDGVEWTESYPYDEATFSRAVVRDVEESKIGVNFGGDVGYYFSRSIGVGGTVMYSGATIELESGGRTVEVKVGGLMAGGGLRLRF
jgi:hypothetical protein